MRYPGYLLNPGDMFQVDPQLVMYATGAPKDRRERREARVASKKAGESESAEQEEGEKSEEKSEENEASEEDGKASEKEQRNPKGTLKGLLSQAKTIINQNQDALPAKRKQELRGFQKAVRRVLSRSESDSVRANNLEEQFSYLISALKVKKVDKKDQEKQALRRVRPTGRKTDGSLPTSRAERQCGTRRRSHLGIDR